MQVDVHVFDGWDELDAVAPYEVLAGAEALDVRLVVLDGPRQVVGAHGLTVRAEAPRPSAGLLVVPGGGWSDPAAPGVGRQVRDGALVAAVADAHARGAVVASVCTGALVLAAAGLLTGRWATTHHTSLADLAAAGAVVAAGEVFVDLGDVATSGGITNGIPLALHLVERFAGPGARMAREAELEWATATGRAGPVHAGPVHAAGDEAAVPPDTKDWTWVLDRPCPECGSDVSRVSPGQVADRLSASVRTWRDVLGRPDVGRRPAPGTWSPLEYAAHVADVLDVAAFRFELVLEQDEPVFPDWDQDATALTRRYPEQDPAVVADALAAGAARALAVLRRADDAGAAAWDRPGRRSNGSRFTVGSFARYVLHDVTHHEHDVGVGAAQQ